MLKEAYDQIATCTQKATNKNKTKCKIRITHKKVIFFTFTNNNKILT